MAGFIVVIPARYAATRLPGKPLQRVAGKPLIQHVYERAIESRPSEVLVATDDERVREAVETFGGRVCMTGTNHRSASDRLAEVVRTSGYSDDRIIVNLQGDEPLMPAALIRQVAENLDAHPKASVATLCEPIKDREELFNPHVVKVVTDQEGYALYFSRAVIPWHRDEFSADRNRFPTDIGFFRHLGLYAYRAGFLEAYTRWTPCALEKAESLEQLRVLWHGHRIHVARAVEPGVAGVDTPEDLERIRRILE